MASLFAAEFTYVLYDKALTGSQLPDFQACAKSMFNELIMFISSSHYSFVERTGALKEWANDQMSDDTYHWLIKLVEGITNSCPLITDDEDIGSSHQFEFMGGLNRGGLHVRDLYTTVWRPWYFINWRDSSDLHSDQIEDVTGKSGALAFQLTKYFGANQEEEGEDRRAAIRIISRYFGFPTEPISDGIALESRADEFFSG
ncbi:MAG TPA: hypothetical protein VGI76_02810, partial [Solirubrobacteraceae bacterium]